MEIRKRSKSMKQSTFKTLVTISCLLVLGSSVVSASEEEKLGKDRGQSLKSGMSSVPPPEIETSLQSMSLETPRTTTERQIVIYPAIKRIEKYWQGSPKKSWLSGTRWCKPPECQSREILEHSAQVIISEEYASGTIA